MAGAVPTHKIIRKDPHTGKWESIGAGWYDEERQSTSLSLELTSGAEKIRCLLVKNEQKKKEARPAHLASRLPVSRDAVGDDEIPF